MTQLLLPPLHVRDWKAKLGTWLQRWVASHRSLFPSLFLPKIRVVETRSATLGDRIYNYRKWQQRWTPDTSFPCRCIDVDDRATFRAHSHAVILSEFQCINTTIDSDVMSASMKDQYFGDVDKLQQRFVLQLHKLARRWKVQGSSFNADSQTILSELFDEHRSNVQDKVHWTSESLHPTARALTTWVVIPADHFPSRAHVICPTLFSTLLHKAFCTGEVFALCNEPAASFRAEVVTMIPPQLRQRYAWGYDSTHPFLLLAFCPNRPRTGSKRDQSFLSFAHGHHLSSRSLAPSSLSSPKSPFRTYRDSFRFRSWYINSGRHCRPQTLRNKYSCCHSHGAVSPGSSGSTSSL